jgi:expansin (peptidoglycan-binding protein)
MAGSSAVFRSAATVGWQVSANALSKVKDVARTRIKIPWLLMNAQGTYFYQFCQVAPSDISSQGAAT